MKFKISLNKSNELYHFILISGNGTTILTSQGYKSKQSTKVGISSVIENIVLADRFVHHSKKNGQVYFQLKAANGEVIADSQVYDDQASMETDIESLMKDVPKASILDLTEQG